MKVFLVLQHHTFIDNRGLFRNIFRAGDPAFSRIWGERHISQVNLSRTEQVGVVRGLHLQSPPHSEAKLVCCLHGCVWDVVVDLRPESKSFGDWYAIELSSDNSNALLVPEGCAHGFQVLQHSSELLYLHSKCWVPEAESGIRYNDPDLNITWPLNPINLSSRDLALPLFQSFL